MNTETNQDGVVDVDTTGEQAIDEVKLSKSEYEELVGIKASHGSLKRDFKKLEKALQERLSPDVDTSQTKQTEDFGLLQKTFLYSADIREADEIELAKEFHKQYKMDWEEIVQDEVFNSRLTKLRNQKANAQATNVEGGAGSAGGVKSADYWIAKGVPPTAKEVPDRKTRVQIINQMSELEKNSGGKFYNE